MLLAALVSFVFAYKITDPAGNYLFVNRNASWSDASQRCTSLGGQLASPAELSALTPELIPLAGFAPELRVWSSPNCTAITLSRDTGTAVTSERYPSCQSDPRFPFVCKLKSQSCSETTLSTETITQCGCTSSETGAVLPVFTVTSTSLVLVFETFITTITTDLEIDNFETTTDQISVLPTETSAFETNVVETTSVLDETITFETNTVEPITFETNTVEPISFETDTVEPINFENNTVEPISFENNIVETTANQITVLPTNTTSSTTSNSTTTVLPISTTCITFRICRPSTSSFSTSEPVVTVSSTSIETFTTTIVVGGRFSRNAVSQRNVVLNDMFPSPDEIDDTENI